MKKQAFNPYLPSYEYIPDGEPYVFDGRVYIFGSHDRFNGTQYCQNNYVCWSASETDLTDWRFEGEIYDKKKDPLCESQDRLLFAPDIAVGVDGRYYMFYAFDFSGVMSVAVCDTPAGEYEFYGHVHYADGTLLGQKEGDAFQFDPGVLVDEDGRVYLYSGFCPEEGPWKYIGLPEPVIKGGMVIELEQDMVTVKKAPSYIFPWVQNSQGTGFEGHEFFEASSIRKIKDTYYFIYSSVQGHELCYATSKYPNRDFVYGGTIISNGDINLNGRSTEDALNYTGNNHGSIAEINGEWYVFYHRQTNKHQFSRQGCAEKIVIEKDDSIKQVEMTSLGLNGEPLLAEGKYDARIACILVSREGAMRYEFGEKISDIHPFLTQEGIDGSVEESQYIANMRQGATAGFKYFIVEKMVSGLTVELRGNGKGKILVGTAPGCFDVAAIDVHTDQEWSEFAASVQLPMDNTFALYFTFEGEGAVDFKAFSFV